MTEDKKYKYKRLQECLNGNVHCFYQITFGLSSYIKDKLRDISRTNKYVITLTILFNEKQHDDYELLKENTIHDFMGNCTHKIGTNRKNKLFKLLDKLNNEKVIINFEKNKKYNLLKQGSRLRDIMDKKIDYLFDVVNANEVMHTLDNFISKIDNQIEHYKLYEVELHYFDSTK